MSCKQLLLKSCFMISLDIELLWGVIHTNEYYLIRLLKEAGGEGIRRRINNILKSLERFEIPATWAFVGHLFLDRCDKERGVPHLDMPRPTRDWYSVDPCTDIERNPLYYGRDIVERVIASEIDHEIGYHSFSHVQFSKCRRDVAEAEIKKGIEISKDFGINLVSFVFPDNQVGHLDLLSSNGFKIYRGPYTGKNPSDHGGFKRIVYGIQNKFTAYQSYPFFHRGLWCVQGSMSVEDRQLPWIALPKFNFWLKRAVESNTLFHLVIHPWELLLHDSSELQLSKMLKIASELRYLDKIEILTMKELANKLDSENKGHK
jgi:peptidoglycan/xylan/chitin deacetylase (PgdA/CDA1 family)